MLQKVEKKDSEAADITASVRDLPTVKTAVGRARVWLRLALMQKKLSDYFRLLVSEQQMLAEFYEPSSLIRSDEANLISALLTSLNVVDCNLCVKVRKLEKNGTRNPVSFLFSFHVSKHNNIPFLIENINRIWLNN